MLAFQNNYSFIWKSKLKRQLEIEGQMIIRWFTPQMVTLASVEPGQSQELSASLQSRGWIGSGAVRTWVTALWVCQHHKFEFICCTITPASLMPILMSGEYYKVLLEQCFLKDTPKKIHFLNVVSCDLRAFYMSIMGIWFSRGCFNLIVEKKSRWT